VYTDVAAVLFTVILVGGFYNLILKSEHKLDVASGTVPHLPMKNYVFAPVHF
jgi:hypothetical protein